jgi:probable phosphoglycerate mutase
MMKELILVRHGETDFNTQGRYQGAIDTDLNENGRLQAMQVAVALRDRPFDVLASSPLKRAVQTAEVIARETDKRIVLADEFVERNLGVFEGLNREEAQTRFPHLWNRLIAKHMFHAPDGGESLCACTYRVWLGIDRLNREYPGKRVLVVSHAAVARVVRGRFVQMTNEEFAAYVLGNGQWVSYPGFQAAGDEYTEKIA